MSSPSVSKAASCRKPRCSASTTRPFADGKDAAAADGGFSNVDRPSFHEMACEIQHKEHGRLSPKGARLRRRHGALVRAT